MISKAKLDTTRAIYARFRERLEKGDRDDPANLVAVMELSGFLAEAVPYLLDEIERLADRDPDGRARIVKFDGGQVGRA